MPHKLFVQNLLPTVTEDHLRTLFTDAGDVLEVERPVDRETGEPRHFAFVTLDTEHSLETLIEHYDGITLEDQTIVVKEAKPRKSKLKRREAQQLAGEIADKLKEEAKRPRVQVLRIIEECGPEFAQKALEDTLEIERNDGMMTLDGTRRRTLGGVFFKLAKDRMPEETRIKIFPNWRELKRRKKEQKLKAQEQANAEQEKQQDEEPSGDQSAPASEPMLDLEEVAQFLNELHEAEAEAEQRLADIKARRIRGGMLDALKEVADIKSRINALLRDYPELR